MTISVKDSNQIEHDEIKTYLNMRYVTPHEAFWRIFEFTLDEKSHAVTRLDVHLPNEQLVYYKPENDDIRQRLSDAELRNTMLTAWFELNARVPEARTLYYYEIPEKYTYKKGAHGMIWDRKGGITGMVNKPCLGRMYAIHPKQGELFYLRMLLLHKKGVQSWEDLLTTEDFDGDTEPKETFQDACRAMGLLDGNVQWEAYFDEAKDHATPFQLRELFVAVITHGENVDVRAIWDRFKEDFAEDFSRNDAAERAERRALVEIEKMLDNAGDSLTNYGFDKPNMAEFENEKPWDPVEEIERGNAMRRDMYPAQERVVAFVLKKIEELKNGTLTNGCIFIDGPGAAMQSQTVRQGRN
ncbi:hypothetical protein WR25_02821 [Diploscapter pachys]|uniref:ATP-dependent DNA helicase n=1 Tax=Diploscapter pachys TaxID=2018661 RepID=A0A2A2LAB0_9BILA|nr:hypothetical protein WR25_02821 [Diploscapter pachys]